MILFVSVEDYGLICVIKLSLCAGCSLLIIGLHKVVPLFFIIKQEVNYTHFGVYPLELRIGVKIDGAGKGVLNFWVIAGDLERSVVVVSVDSD